MAHNAPDTFAVQSSIASSLLLVFVELVIRKDLEGKSGAENKDGGVVGPFERSRQRGAGTVGRQISHSKLVQAIGVTHLAYGFCKDSVKGREITACTTASGRKYLKNALFQKPGSCLSARYRPSSEFDLALRDATW